MEFHYCIFKIFTYPIKSLPPIAQADFLRKKKSAYNVDIASNVIKSLNPHMSEIKYVYRNVVTIGNDGIMYPREGTEKIETLENFIAFCSKSDTNLKGWIGWNCNVFDIPFILMSCLKKGIQIGSYLKILNSRRYYKLPVFDMQDFLSNFGYASNLAVTAETLGYVSLNPSSFFDLEGIYERDNEKEQEDYIMEQGRMILKVFEKCYHLYF